jgi:hypothetical protein
MCPFEVAPICRAALQVRCRSAQGAFRSALSDQLLLTRLSKASSIFTPGLWHLVGLFYIVELKPGSLVVTETDGSTCAVAWTPLSGLEESLLSPAAIDGLGMIGA